MTSCNSSSTDRLAKFQFCVFNLKAKHAVPGIECKSEYSPPPTYPTGFVEPSTPCILVAALKIWYLGGDCCASNHTR